MHVCVCELYNRRCILLIMYRSEGKDGLREPKFRGVSSFSGFVWRERSDRYTILLKVLVSLFSPIIKELMIDPSAASCVQRRPGHLN